MGQDLVVAEQSRVQLTRSSVPTVSLEIYVGTQESHGVSNLIDTYNAHFNSTTYPRWARFMFCPTSLCFFYQKRKTHH